MLAKVFSSALLGIDAYRVEVEVDITSGLPVKTLSQVVAFLTGFSRIAPQKTDVSDIFERNGRFAVDFAEVKGQEHVKRALEIAAAGGHNLLMLCSI